MTEASSFLTDAEVASMLDAMVDEEEHDDEEEEAPQFIDPATGNPISVGITMPLEEARRKSGVNERTMTKQRGHPVAAALSRRTWCLCGWRRRMRGCRRKRPRRSSAARGWRG